MSNDFYHHYNHESIVEEQLIKQTEALQSIKNSQNGTSTSSVFSISEHFGFSWLSVFFKLGLLGICLMAAILGGHQSLFPEELQDNGIAFYTSIVTS